MREPKLDIFRSRAVTVWGEYVGVDVRRWASAARAPNVPEPDRLELELL
jgi:CRISPR/Cas system endoribonuclease Cas6 (RAMP superfamily)